VTSRRLILFIVRRLLVFLLLLLGLSFVIFSLLYIAPGSAVDALLGLKPRTPSTVAAIKQEYHLNEPFLTQYWLWLKGALHFDFGNSIQTSLPVSDSIKSRLPTSLFLGLYAFFLTMVVGLALGVVSTLRRRTAVDRTIVAGTIFGLSMPTFVSCVLLLYFGAILLKWFPSYGTGSGFINELWHLTLPAVALTLVSAAFLVKNTRAAMVAVIDQDYVTFARARGLSGRRVLFGYVLRNAMIPIVTIGALILSFVITGAVVVEVAFNLPGIGNLLVQSANTKDLPALQGVALVIAVVIMGANLLADLLYFVADPRIRYGVASR
jgi:peptide/nickel transport system permease protein